MRTIRPLDLKEPLASARVQFEDSSLTSGLSGRYSGALGNLWENAEGQAIGFAVSGSYTESENTAFRPRLDRDNLTVCQSDDPGFVTPLTCPAGASGFLGVQFLNQVQRTTEFETYNIAGSFEAKPTDDIVIFADVVYNDQEQTLSGSRVQASNVSRLNGGGDQSTPPGSSVNFTDFDNVDLGSARGVDGTQDFGDILIVTDGTFTPLQADSEPGGRGAPFFRVGSDAGSRFTDTTTLRLGGDWEATDALTLGVEYARSTSNTVNPNLSVNLNFINPNSFIAPSGSDFRDENGTPIVFDLGDGFGFDVNFDDPFAPTEAQLLDPANYVFDGSPTFSGDIRENLDKALRFDGKYEFEETPFGNFIDSVEAGVRFGTRTSIRDDQDGSTSGSSSLSGSVNAAGISQFLNEIPDNFASGTGNDLAVDGVLQVDPNLTRDQRETIDAINDAAAAQGLGQIIDPNLSRDLGAFFDIKEETTAVYGQVNFDVDLPGAFGIRGNAGLRYIDTDIESTGNVFDSDGNAILTTVDSGYDHYLPRINLAVDVTEDIVLRGSYTEEISRPSFTQITSGRTFPNEGGVNSNSVGGNPFVVPEEVTNYEASIDWYFAPEAVLSVGYFRKTRDGLIGEDPLMLRRRSIICVMLPPLVRVAVFSRRGHHLVFSGMKPSPVWVFV